MESKEQWCLEDEVQRWAGMIRPRYLDVCGRIGDALQRSGRLGAVVEVVGVTKTLPEAAVLGAAAAGIGAVGENRVQEAVPKMDACVARGCTSLAWHLIGHLQRNKAGKVVNRFSLIHSVDSMRLASVISRLAEEGGVVQPVLIQVDISGEDSKFGWSPGLLERELDALMGLSGLDVRGFMTIAPFLPDPEEVRPVFAGLREFSERMAGAAGRVFPELSMGMSGDYVVAVEEGATVVRVGSGIFGARG